ncbi:MAG: F0F1 ATP synthase subunit A [Candidatus Melainabacteria bacterium]|nr:F0F1 ATP synthase subunit A [Candidatus Melainabacteria bacterium]
MLGKNLHLSQFVHDPAINNLNVLGPLGDVHVDTLILSWICMGGILGAAALITPKLVVDGAGGKGQAVLEMIYSFTQEIAKGQIGHSYRKFYPLIAAIFIFVIVGNFIGVGPWRAFEQIPGWFHLSDGEPFELASPTTDFNVTAGLALISLLTYLGSGFWAHGAKFIKTVGLNPIEWLDLIVRPSTLALRLMVVITADELMRGAFLLILPILLPAGIMAFELFIGTIQAFVFALLTSIYIGLTVAEHH